MLSWFYRIKHHADRLQGQPPPPHLSHKPYHVPRTLTSKNKKKLKTRTTVNKKKVDPSRVVYTKYEVQSTKNKILVSHQMRVLKFYNVTIKNSKQKKSFLLYKSSFLPNFSVRQLTDDNFRRTGTSMPVVGGERSWLDLRN